MASWTGANPASISNSFLVEEVRMSVVTPMGKPPPLAVRLAKALPFQCAQRERRCGLTAHDYRHIANGALPGSPLSLAIHQSKDDVLPPPRRQQGVCIAFWPFLYIVGPLWGPSSNYPLCG